MNKIYTFGVPKLVKDRIVDARASNYTIVGEMEVYDGMSDKEFDKTRKEIGIPDNAVVLCVRAV